MVRPCYGYTFGIGTFIEQRIIGISNGVESAKLKHRVSPDDERSTNNAFGNRNRTRRVVPIRYRRLSNDSYASVDELNGWILQENLLAALQVVRRVGIVGIQERYKQSTGGHHANIPRHASSAIGVPD